MTLKYRSKKEMNKISLERFERIMKEAGRWDR